MDGPPAGARVDFSRRHCSESAERGTQFLPGTPSIPAPSSRPRRTRSQRFAGWICAGALLAVAGACTGAIAVPLPRTVTITADGMTQTRWIFGQSVRDALSASKVALGVGDRLVPAPDTALRWGMQIEVVRAVPFELKLGGSPHEVSPAGATVGDALTALGITLGPGDRVYPPAGTPLTPAMRVTVVRREWQSWVESRPIPVTSETVNDTTLFKGQRVLRSTGRPGTEQRTVNVLYADGRLRTMLVGGWSVAQAPAPRITAVGTRAMVASRGAFAGREYVVFEATAYYPGPNNFGGGVGPRTAIGIAAERGVVAVDPSVIRLGSHLYIEGYGYAIAGDTGGNIQGRRIDLCYNTYSEAMQFGRRPVRVFILDQP